MTKEQLTHYLKGGFFVATYKPKVTSDLGRANLNILGLLLEVYQNCMVAPLQEPASYVGQHAFNSPDISGWFPEEDIKNLEILPDKFKDYPETLPRFVYKLYYSEVSQLKPNFGKGNWKVPMVVSREYSVENDKGIIELSSPQASKIEKAIWDGTSELKWEVLKF